MSSLAYQLLHHQSWGNQSKTRKRKEKTKQNRILEAAGGWVELPILMNCFSQKNEEHSSNFMGQGRFANEQFPIFLIPCMLFGFSFLKTSTICSSQFLSSWEEKSQAKIKITKRSQFSLSCTKPISVMFPNRTTVAFHASLYSAVNTVTHEEKGKGWQLFPPISKP